MKKNRELPEKLPVLFHRIYVNRFYISSYLKLFVFHKFLGKVY